MSDELTPRIALPTLAAGQAQKEMVVNEAFQRLDALVQPVAMSASLTVPPTSPTEGACWIVPAGATGSWGGQEGAIAQWTGGGWRFFVPANGWRYSILDSESEMIFDAGSWRQDAVRADGFYIAGQRIVGPRLPDIGAPTGGTIVDGQARSSVNEILSILRAHGLIGS